jgi:hypothetical protein
MKEKGEQGRAIKRKGRKEEKMGGIQESSSGENRREGKRNQKREGQRKAKEGKGRRLNAEESKGR